MFLFIFLQFFSPEIHFQSYSIVVRKDAWYDFNFLKFSEDLYHIYFIS